MPLRGNSTPCGYWPPKGVQRDRERASNLLNVTSCLDMPRTVDPVRIRPRSRLAWPSHKLVIRDY